MVTQHLDLFVRTALLLPGFYQRAIMEINVQMGIVAVLDIHFKHPLRCLGKQGFLQSLQRISAAGLCAQVRALIQSAALDGRRCIFLWGKTFLTCLIAQQIPPLRSVLQLLTDRNDQFIANLGFIANRHFFFPPVLVENDFDSTIIQTFISLRNPFSGSFPKNKKND